MNNQSLNFEDRIIDLPFTERYEFYTNVGKWLFASFVAAEQSEMNPESQLKLLKKHFFEELERSEKIVQSR